MGKINKESGFGFNGTRGRAMKLLFLFIAICAALATAIALSVSSTTVNFQDEKFDPLAYFQTQTFDHYIVDVDAGGDDAVAMLLGLSIGPEKILAFTTCVGNTNRDQVNKNVLRILRVANSNIPVYSGAESAILATPPSDNFYGIDGLGDFEDSPVNMSLIQEEHAVNAMLRLVKEYPNKITIIALGPLTNLALATRLDPSFRKNVKAIFWTGGAARGYGNVKPGIEFNAYIDPIANWIIFNSDGPPVIMVTTELFMVTSNTTVKWRTEVLGTIDTPEIKFLNQVERLSIGKEFWNTADSKTFASAINPKLITEAGIYRVEAVYEGNTANGAFMVDYWGKVSNKPKNAIIIEKLDVPSFMSMLLDGFGKANKNAAADR